MSGIERDRKGRNIISQPTFVKEFALGASDFEGNSTDQLFVDSGGSVPYLEYPAKPRKIRSKFGKGFLVKPDATGTIEVLAYEQYANNGKTINAQLDAQKVTLRVTAGQWHEVRCIKVYGAGASGVTAIEIGV